MRVVLDTNTVVSGLLWPGPASLLLRSARTNKIQLFTSAELLAELEDVLPRPQFARKLSAARMTAQQLAYRYALLAKQIVPANIHPHIEDDPDDDAVLACALAAAADYIVSGDGHLRRIKHYHRIQIVSPTDALSLMK